MSPQIWRTLHNVLLVADNLRKRRMRVDNIYQLCGDYDETVNHLLFQCKLTKEIWDLAPLSTPTGDFIKIHYLSENLQMMLSLNRNRINELKLFFLVGWRIWKMRNALIFESRRMSIPDIINKALIDLSIWNDVCKPDQRTQQSSSNVLTATRDVSHTFEDAISKSQEYFCFVDGSWISPTHQSGIGWALYNKYSQLVIKCFKNGGSSS